MKRREVLKPEVSPVVIDGCGLKHDALTAMVREGVAKEYGLMMVEEMRKPPAWAPGVPLDAELKMGKRYGQLEEVKI